MRLSKLSAKEQEIVLQSMKATAAHVDDWEKHSRLGLETAELELQIARWPNIDDSRENSNGFLAINNCLNEVCHGFRIAPEAWDHWFEWPISDIESTYKKWLAVTVTPGGIR